LRNRPELGIVEGRADRLHHLDRVAGPDVRAEDLHALDLGEEADLGDLGSEHPTGMVEQRDEGLVDLGAALEDPGGLVEHLQAFVLLALGHIGAVGDEDRGDRHGEEQRCGRLDEEDGDQEERQARVGERDDRPHQEHPRNPGVLRLTLGERDHGGDGQNADHVLGRRCEERGGPVAWAKGRPDADQQVDDSDGHDRAEEELGEVEAELRRALPPAEDQGGTGADQARGDELSGREEEDPVDNRDLAHRERVGAPADVEVDHPRLGHVEEDREEPPRQRQRRRGGGTGRQLGRCDPERDGRQHDGQGPDPSRARRRRGQPAGEVAHA